MSFLEIIIDGYNFLKTTGMLDVQVSDLELEKGRKRLIQFLCAVFPEKESRQKLSIVFDSATLLDLPDQLTMHDIKVRFSKGYDSADELIMEMIRANTVPKRLLIVSSDHEIQTCAKRRKASFIDSDAWLDELEDLDRRQKQGKPSAKQSDGAKDEDPEYWMSVFGDIEVPDSLRSGHPIQPKEKGIDRKSHEPESSEEPPSKRESSEPLFTEQDLKDAEELSQQEDLFPPGYGEDLLD